MYKLAPLPCEAYPILLNLKNKLTELIALKLNIVKTQTNIKGN